MVFRHIERAFNAYRKNWVPVLGSVLIFVGAAVFLGALFLLMLISGAAVASSGFPIFFLLFFAGIVGAVLLFVALDGSLYGVYYRCLRGRARIEDYLKTFSERAPSIIGANLISAGLLLPLAILGLVSALYGLSFLLVLSLVLLLAFSVFFLFVNQAVVIHNKKALEAVETSVRFAWKNFPGTAALFVVFFLSSLVLGYISLVYRQVLVGELLLWLFVSPLFRISLTDFYVKRSRGRI